MMPSFISQGSEYAESEATVDGAQGSGAHAFDSPRFWRWMTLGLAALAFGKGIREPNQWSYTQAQLDYSVGFMRRGLFGATVGHLLGLNHYTRFVVASTALLLLLFALLALYARASRLDLRTPPGELLAVYASSYSVSYLAHLNGYLDIPLALLCLLPLFLRSTVWRVAAAAVCTCVGLLIHEQFFFAFLPVLIASVVLGAATAGNRPERRVAWVGAALLIVLGVGITTYLGRFASISDVQAAQLKESSGGRADRPLEAEVFKVLPRTPRENLELMKTVWARRTFLPAQVESLLMFGPTAAVLSWATLVALKRWQPGRHRWIYAVVLMGTLAPLSLHLMGWDKNRWNELLCLNAFMLLLTVSRLLGGEPFQLPVRLRRACLVVILLNMATGGGMFDNRHIRPFPFMRNPDAAVVNARIPGRDLLAQDGPRGGEPASENSIAMGRARSLPSRLSGE